MWDLNVAPFKWSIPSPLLGRLAKYWTGSQKWLENWSGIQATVLMPDQKLCFGLFNWSSFQFWTLSVWYSDDTPMGTCSIEWSGDLNAVLVRYSNDQTDWMPDLNTGLIDASLCTGLIFKWSVKYKGHSTLTYHLFTKPFETWISKSPVFNCFCYSNGRHSVPHCIWTLNITSETNHFESWDK